MATITATKYRLGWERIFGKQTPKGSLFLLPSASIAAVVQYDSDLRISCVLPPTNRRIGVEWGKKHTSRNIEVPFLLFSHLIYLDQYVDQYTLADRLGINLDFDDDYEGCDCNNCKLNHIKDKAQQLDFLKHSPICSCSDCLNNDIRLCRLSQLFYLFAVYPEEQQRILAQPYRLANIYEDGKICFKKAGSDIRVPQNLREANSCYWSTRFDNDFERNIPHICDRKVHRYRNCTRISGKHKCQNWPHHYHTCEEEEDDFDDDCECCYGDCDCYARCPCCIGACLCKTRWTIDCQCDCCQNICNCRCNCNLVDSLANMLVEYEPHAVWEDYSEYICGKGFLSTSKKIDGIFISNNKDLLEDIPARYQLRFKYKPLTSAFEEIFDRAEEPIIIGFATRTLDGSWKVVSGDFEFTLSEKQIHIVN